MSSSTVRGRLSLFASLVLLVSTASVLAQVGSSASAAGGAISSTTNVNASTGNGECVHPPGSGTDPTNCNTYNSKQDVWLSNLPQALPDGDYFFAVTAPGDQSNPNDGAAGLLSAGTHDDRSFRVAGNVVTSLGNHLVENGRVQLFDFADTTNHGGVYIVSVCSLAAYPASGSDCKHDAFKVGPSTTPNNADDLVVTKDAAGADNRTYSWSIAKSVDKTSVHQVGGNAIFNYAVDVNLLGSAVSNVTVSGTITVANFNAADVVGVDVTDVLSNTTACAVTGGTDATILPGNNTFAYTCSLAGLPAGQLDNTASAAWDAQTVDGKPLAANSADFTFDDIQFAETAVDECVTVTDVFNGQPATTLGSRCVGDADVDYTYQRSIPVVPGCVSYANTATYTTNDSASTGSAGRSVQVCGPLATGALTIGFWSNKNGQGVITGGASTANVCNVGTYLRTFAPFADLSASAKCADVAKYYTNVFGAANASGPTMNAMLKAQMLATALDVYFTGTGSTSATQKFLPHSNMGGATIDLTAICKNIPTCSVLQNVSGSFGGATSLTVSQMLAYAASQSNVGGTSWYGQNKLVQEGAKNAFDAINNQVAFGI
ncbi:MAG: hypothetical protein ACJ72D_27635 [Marmoricola sp.]